jgi:serine/threonine-protein kinase
VDADAKPLVLAERYELGAVIGRGAVGQVYSARDLRLGREVAVKVLRPELAADPDTRRRFESEARLAARLDHPNVVAVFDCGESDGVPYLVMERLPGRSLADAIAEKPVPPDEARLITAQVLDALAAAHAAGMVHRDVKPGNVLASGAGLWKVADFGIAKSLEVSEGDATVTGIVMGTPAYLAPERVAGGHATVATDVYATGVLLYEALSGRRPVEAGASPAALLAPDPIPISVLCPDLPADLASVVTRAMSADAAGRFPDAAAMADALRRRPGAADTATVVMTAPPADAGAGDAATRAIPPQVTTAPAATRGGPSRALLLAGAVAAAVIVVVVLAIAGLRHHPSAGPATPAPAPAPSGTLPGPLDSALRHLQQEVQP